MSNEQVTSNSQAEKAQNGEEQKEQSIESCVEFGKRAFALRQYETAIENYATALELSTAKYGDRAPESADLLFEYGKALLENAIVQSAVLAKEDGEKGDDDEADKAKNDPRFNFESDGDGEPDEELNLATLPDDEPEEDEEEEPEQDEESPEDDFNAAWEVLDLARVIYDKQQEEDDEIKLKLADTYLALGDVSLETEKFDQAIDDYTAAINLKSEVLPFSSRQVAEGHLKLALVLDITSGRLADAIQHVELSIQSVEERLSELRLGPQSQSSLTDPESVVGPQKDLKGKGKRRKLVRDAAVSSMTPIQIEEEIKDLEGMKSELQMKLDEIKTNPAADAQGLMPASGSAKTAPELAAKELDKELNSAAASAASKVALMANEVTDLTGLVKKKKKVNGTVAGDQEQEAQANGLKRKSPEESEQQGPDKRPKIANEAQPTESS